MDQLLSQLIPTQRVGSDGFNWWVGQVEGTAADEKNNKGGYRFKVRIVGDHPKSKEILDTKDLPWANVMMPVNVPFMPGNVGGAHPQLIKGCWVIGFYLDNDRQKPIIMGSIGQTPSATTVSKSERPDDDGFETYNNITAARVDPAKDGVPAPENPEGGEAEPNTQAGPLSDGTTNEEGEDRVDEGDRKRGAIDQEEWCQITAEKCKKPDLKTQITSILGELLRDIQKSNGKIGTYYINNLTGDLNNSISDGRSKVDKAIRVVREFLGKVKGFIKKKIGEAVDFLVKALLYPDGEKGGNILTPVTEWFNNLLKDLGCQMADLGERLEKWLTNVLMNFIGKIYRAAICQVDEFVNGIISKINQLMNELLNSILGPLQDILGAIAGPLNLIGEAINFVFKLLGISCSGPDQTCSKYKEVCTSGEKKKDEDDKDFLDDLLADIDGLFGDTPPDYTQYVCDEAYTGNPLQITTVGFVGGVPKESDLETKRPKLIYNIDDITVVEGQVAEFTITREGEIDIASSVKFKTIDSPKSGTATVESDYLPVSEIVGFNIGETEKVVTVQTLTDSLTEQDETFFVTITTNSPINETEVETIYIKGTARCTITEENVKEPYDPYKPPIVDPFPTVPGTEQPDEVIEPPAVDDDTDIDPDPDTDSDTPPTVTPTYTVTSNRSTCPEGEFIIYTVKTKFVANGSILYYNLSGTDITTGDIVGGKLSGSFIINNGEAKITVGIEEDNLLEDQETLTFTLTGKGASVDVLITVDTPETPEDPGVGDDPTTVFEPFVPPTVKPPITDDNGGIIEIPIDDPGDPWSEPPVVFIGGQGSGATATGLLDESGRLTEIRVQSPGYGYKLNLASDNGVRCIIDAFTVLRPGVRYTSQPDMYVDGRVGVAEAIINDDGFVIGARVLDRETTFLTLPSVDIVGGGGYGARLLPSLACLDTEQLTTIGSTKIGTGKYIDCP